jgi:HEXXH motif-containing protein
VQGHLVPARVIDDIFAGPVGAAAVDTLRAGQHSRRLLLLKELREHVPDAVWDVLVEAERHDPDVVRDILAYPSVGAWLVRAVRKLRGVVEDDVPVRTDLGYVGAIAAAAAVRAGVPAEVDVPVLHGRVSLPTVGQFTVTGDSVVRMRVAESAAFLESGEPVDLCPLRTHDSTAAGQSVRWTIDDIDPYRTFDVPEAPRRLGPDEYAHWCGQLDEVWASLVAEHPDHVPEVVAIGPVVVPVPPKGTLIAVSSASAFGAICLTPPTSCAVLAETVVHEVQHSKLNALFDLVALQEPGSNPLCYAPWRRDPRPLSGLLHGIYAFTGVVEYWRRQVLANPGPNALFTFAHQREQVLAALRVLGPAPALTELGVRFLDISAERLAACGDIPVPDDVLAAVDLLSAENRLAWRLRHLAAPEERITALARRWLAGERAPGDVSGSEMRPDHRPDTRSGLTALVTLRAVEPARFATAPGPAEPGELELAQGHHAAAATAFADRLHANAADDAAWVGLLLAARADEVLPEVLAATYRHLAAVSVSPPDPVAFVDWFASR